MCLWVLSGTSGVVFDIQPSRGPDACRALLDGFAGMLIADGYAVYSSLEKALSRNGEQLALDDNLQLPQPDPTPAGPISSCPPRPPPAPTAEQLHAPARG